MPPPHTSFRRPGVDVRLRTEPLRELGVLACGAAGRSDSSPWGRGVVGRAPGIDASCWPPCVLTVHEACKGPLSARMHSMQ